jgi:hypothetical protein
MARLRLRPGEIRRSLRDRITQQSKELMDRANSMAPGIERDRLLRRVRIMNTAENLEGWMASSELKAPT